MACTEIGPGMVVCGPSNAPNLLRKRYYRCPSCECTTEMVERHEGWYGRTVMCCRCGDSWNDGWCYRPFARNWRKERVAKHRQLWDVATFGPAPSLEEQGV
jgi:hypothetical protein